jgi:hypothetical protein
MTHEAQSFRDRLRSQIALAEQHKQLLRHGFRASPTARYRFSLGHSRLTASGLRHANDNPRAAIWRRISWPHFLSVSCAATVLAIIFLS